MNIRRRLAENVPFLGVATSVFRKASILVFSILYVRTLGKSNYGLVVAVLSILTPLGVFASLGTNKLLIKALTQTPRNLHREILSRYFKWCSIVAIVLSTAVALGAGILNHWLGELDALESTLRWSSWLILPICWIKFGTGSLLGLRLEKAYFVSMNLVEPFVRLSAIPLLALLLYLHATHTLWYFLPEILAGLSLSGFMLWKSYSFSGWHLRQGQESSTQTTSHDLAAGLSLTGHELAGLAFLSIDKWMIAAYTQQEENLSFYNVTLTLAALIMLFHRNLVRAFSAKMSVFAQSSQRTHLQRYYGDGAQLSFALAAGVYLGFLCFGREILQVYGEEFENYYLLLAILGAGHLMDTFCGAGGFLLIAQGRSRILLYNAFGLIALNVGLNAFLIPRMGLNGAALATALSYSAKNLVLLGQNYRFAKVHPLNRRHLMNWLFVAVFATTFLLVHGLNFHWGIRLLLWGFGSAFLCRPAWRIASGLNRAHPNERI